MARKDRLKEVYEYVRKHFPIHTQADFADEIRYNRAYLSSAMNGNEKNLTNKLFQNICEAFPGVFNIKYLLNGEGNLLTIEEEVRNEDIEKLFTQAHIQQPVDYSSLVNAALAAKDETIAALREQIQAKDDLIASLRQNIEILQHQVHAAKDEELFKDFPFPKGIADKKDKPSAHV